MIESPVVIAIIGILAALMLPVLSAAKDKAKRTICLNNLRQINVGIRMYSDDANDMSPSATNRVWARYKELMQGYVGLGSAPTNDNKLFVCPSDTFHYSFAGKVWFVPTFVPQGQHRAVLLHTIPAIFSTDQMNSPTGPPGTHCSALPDGDWPR